MDIVEKVCMVSYSTPQKLDLKHCLPHNYLYDIPIQSREVAKQINVLGEQPVFQAMKFTSSLTLPVFEPVVFNLCDLQKDPLRGILEDKEDYLNQLKQYILHAKKRKAEDPTFMRNVKESIDRNFVANHKLVNLAECLATDPHPYFSESYVWLPVGGSIKHISLKNKTYIIAPDGNKFDKIRAIPVRENCGWQQDGTITRVDCLPGERILQIVTSEHKKRGYVGVRRLRGFSVIRLKPSNDGSLKSRQLIDVSDPTDALTALDISSLYGELACTLDKSNCVKIYDVAAGKCLVDYKITDKDAKTGSHKDHDSSAKFIQFSKQPFMVYIVNKRKLYLKDTRVPFNSPGTTFNVYDQSDGCEVLSVCAESILSDTLYCSSAHHTFSLDPRRGWFKRWNHGLDNMPLYLNVGVTESLEEMVVTASMEMGSATGILNTWKATEEGLRPSFCSFPAKLPSIRDTSFWANTKGYWLEPSIAKRIESSLCGMTLVRNQSGPGCSLFTLNSVGDVFCASFRPDKHADSEAFLAHKAPGAETDGVQQVRQWQESHMNLKSHMDLHCESLTDRSYLLTIMKQHLHKNAVARNRVRKWKLAIAIGKKAIRPRQAFDKDKPLQESRLRQMSLCNDWLACEILPFWNMDNLIEQARIHHPDSAIVIDSSDESS